MEKRANDAARLPEIKRESAETQPFLRIVENRNAANKLETSIENTVAERSIAARAEAVAAGLGIDPRTLARTLMAGIVALGISAKEVGAQTPERAPQLTQQQMDLIGSVIGMPFRELEAQFKVEMPIPESKSGAYIIHIGQLHRDTVGNMNAMMQGLIVGTQRKMEVALLSVLKANNLSCVFEEGFAEDDDGEKIRDAAATSRKGVAELVAEPLDDFASFMKVLDKFEKWSEGAKQNILIRHLVGHQIAELQKKLETAVRDKTVRLAEDNPELREAQENILDMSLMSIALKGMTSSLSTEKPDPYFMGATLKIYLEGGVPKICPAEDEQINKQAIGALKEELDAQQAFDNHIQGMFRQMLQSPEIAPLRQRREVLAAKGEANLSDAERAEVDSIVSTIRQKYAELKAGDEMKPYQERLDRAKPEVQRLTMTGREQEVLRQIARQDETLKRQGKTTPEHALVVYGAAHDFYRVTTKWNLDNPHLTQRGLIKLTPKQGAN